MRMKQIWKEFNKSDRIAYGVIVILFVLIGIASFFAMVDTLGITFKNDTPEVITPTPPAVEEEVPEEPVVEEPEPVEDTITFEEKSELVAIPHETIIREVDTLYIGEENVIQQGQDGQIEIVYQYKIVNGLLESKEETNRITIKEATAHIIERGTKVYEEIEEPETDEENTETESNDSDN